MFGNFLAPQGQFQNPLADPANRLAMMQFAARLLQPIQPGQTLMGQVGQGISDALGAKVQAEDRALRRQDTNFDRQLALAGLGMKRDAFAAEQSNTEFDRGLRLQELELRKNAATSAEEAAALDREIAKEKLALTKTEIAQSGYRAETDRMGVLNPKGSRITLEDIQQSRENALRAYDPYVNDGQTQQEHMTQWMIDIYGTPNPEELLKQQQPGPTMLQVPPAPGSDLVAAPASAPRRDPNMSRIERAQEQAASPDAAVSPAGVQKMSSNQFKQRFPQYYEMIQRFLKSADPREVAKGRLLLQRLKSEGLTDPDHLGL